MKIKVGNKFFDIPEQDVKSFWLEYRENREDFLPWQEVIELYNSRSPNSVVFTEKTLSQIEDYIRSKYNNKLNEILK
jgi:hypothetical protein